MNYLEQCITDLKSQGKGQSAPQRQQSYSRAVQLEEADNDDDDEEMEDQDQDETAISTPSTAPQDHSDSRISLPSLSQLTSMTSPSTLSTGAARHYSVSSTSQASYSPYIHSNQTSPAFGPQLLNVSMINMPYSASKESFGLGSPALKALDSNSSSRELADASSKAADSRRRSSKSRRSEKELDREATAALLMLNHDRRDWSSSRTGEPAKGTNGMSVKDLLSG